MGKETTGGVYQYSMAPTCIWNPLIATTSSSCDKGPQCAQVIKTNALYQFQTKNQLIPIGIVKDGTLQR